ncbi:hypothetical protein T10_3809 [Trichinella papuae]|uniref:Uncharacterized protein n=1 Tax=Trichinella papuae TaxID=268474 RepID=A0A0V1MK40_9BILA|nr:hypothetical protein T10_3809 [Trichinella papuae]
MQISRETFHHAGSGFQFRYSSDSTLAKIQFHNFPHFPFLSEDIVFGNQNNVFDPRSLTIMMPFLVSVQSPQRCTLTAIFSTIVQSIVDKSSNTFGVER